MNFKFNKGDYVETIDGKIGYIDIIHMNCHDVMYGFTMRTSEGIGYGYEGEDLVDLNKKFKRIGKYNFSVGSELKPLSSNINWDFDIKNEGIFKHNIRLGMFDMYDKINEIVNYINKSK